MRLFDIQGKVLDVLVVGGGIVGAGVARDAAMRGLRVVLVDRRDFAFGASSRSSRLLHGGLRYLAQGRLGLVREASVEKVILHRIAPHLAAPLPFIFSTRRGGEWARWKLSIGVKLYDLLCGGRNFGKSSTLDPSEVLDRLPDLAADELTGAVRYFDGFTNDARLVLDTLRSAQKHGAQLFNYAALVSSQRESDAWHCHVQDQETTEKIEIRSRAIVNAAGAWANLMPASRTPLRLTKGVHLVIDRSRLPVPEAVVMPDGKRILFAIPWGERIILGTTDTDYTGNRDTPTCEPEDAEYILRVTNTNFPSAHLSAADIRSAYAGLRPLIADKSGGPSDISRRHVIRQTDPGWFDVAGGKLTTYRLMAEQTVDQLTSAPCTTASTPLLEESDHAFSSILPPPVSREAVEHFCRNEWARHVDDIMLRRTSWQHYADDPEMVAEQTSQWMAHVLGWSEPRREQELGRYREVSAQAHVAAETRGLTPPNRAGNNI